MTWETIGAALWQFANSVPGVMLLAALLGWLLKRLYLWRPAWQPWEGTIIAAVKYAEKAIPDDVPNTSAARLNAALQYILRVYADTRGQPPPEVLIEQLTEGIQIVHEQLEQRGTL